MLQLFKKYGVVIRFITIFLGSYFLLSLLYNIYLDFSETQTKYYPDFITNLVSKQSAAIISALGYTAELKPHPEEESMKLLIEGHYLIRVVEGCNSTSVIILFLSFILSFFSNAKATFFYILSGSVLIYAMNLIRIALLSIGIYKYPEYATFLHEILFPLIIYGTVILLWIFWVRIYANLEKNENQK